MFNWTDLLGWLIVAFAIIGTMLNAHGRREGFYFWLMTNAYWCVHNWNQADYPQTALFFFFFLTCLYGLYRWKAVDQAKK